MTEYCIIKACGLTPRQMALYDSGKYNKTTCGRKNCKKEHKVVMITDSAEWQSMIDDAKSRGFDYDDFVQTEEVKHED